MQTQREDSQPIIRPNFPEKLHENEENVTGGGFQNFTM